MTDALSKNFVKNRGFTTDMFYFQVPGKTKLTICARLRIGVSDTILEDKDLGTTNRMVRLEIVRVFKWLQGK